MMYFKSKMILLMLMLVGCSVNSSDSPHQRKPAKTKPTPLPTNSDDGSTEPKKNDEGDTTSVTGLSKTQNFTMTLVQNKTQNLNTYFGTSDYILLDFSQYGCGYCHDQAEDFQQSTTYKKVFSSGKCKLLITLPSGDLENWVNRYKETSDVGKSSCEVEDQFDIARSFGFELTGTPTTILIDRNGKIVIEDNAYDLESKLQKLCL